MNSQDIDIRLTDRLLKKIDEAARENYQTMSNYIREAIVFRLNYQHIVKNMYPEDELRAFIDQATNQKA